MRLTLNIHHLVFLIITAMILSACNVGEQGKAKVTGQNANAPTQADFAITTAASGINQTNNTSYEISGRCSEAGNFIELRFGPLLQTTNCQADKTWSFNLNLSLVGDGSLLFQALETRPDGSSPSDSFSAVKDSTPPIVSGISDDYTISNSKSFTWGCNETCTFRFLISSFSSSAPVGAYSSITSHTQTTGNGSLSINVQARDAAGNESEVVSGVFLMDTTAPTLTGLSNNSTPVTGTTWNWGCSDTFDPSCTTRFTVDQSPGNAPSGAYNGTTTTSQNSGDGTWYLHIQTTDIFGNVSPVYHFSTVLDNTPPAYLTTVNGMGSSPTTDTADRTITLNAPGDATHYKIDNVTAADCTGVNFAVISEQAISSNFNMVVDEGNTQRLCIITRDVLGNWQTTAMEFPLVVNFPSGMILSYQGASCPIGWTDFSPARGRALFGAGSGNNDGFGSPLTPRNYGASGGLEQTSGIPANAYSASSQTPGAGRVFRQADFNYLTDVTSTNTALDSQIAGSNMAPFLVVRFCRKD